MLLLGTHPKRDLNRAAGGTGCVLEGEVWIIAGDRVMQPAAADVHATFVLDERLHPPALVVVPLRLAGDDGVSGQSVVGVVVLVSLDGLPAEEPSLADAEPEGELEPVTLVRCADKPRRHSPRSSPIS